MRLAPEASVTKLCLKDAIAASLSPSAFIFASKAGHCFGSAGLIPQRLLSDWPMVLRRRSGSEAVAAQGNTCGLRKCGRVGVVKCTFGQDSVLGSRN